MIKHQAIRNIHSNAVTINGDTVWDKDGNEIIIDDTLVQNETDRLQTEYDSLAYARARDISYPNLKEFAEAYTEKEIGGDDAKWNEYVTKYNKVRTDNPKE
jgi:hypothetical protein